MYLDKLQAMSATSNDDPVLLEKTLDDYLKFKKTLLSFELYI